MDEDLRRRYRRDFTKEPIKASPRPAPSPAVRTQNPNTENPSRATESTAQPLAAPVIEQLEIPVKAKRSVKQSKRHKVLLNILIIILVLSILGGGGYFFKYKSSSKVQTVKHYFPSYITKDQMQIATYYPVNLPAELKVDNKFTIIQTNILYYSVSDKAGNKFNITMQPLPPSSVIANLKSKMLKPDEFTTTFGTVVVGVSDKLYGSVRTNDGTWIIIYTTSSGSTNDMETLIRSFKRVEL